VAGLHVNLLMRCQPPLDLHVLVNLSVVKFSTSLSVDDVC